MPTRHDPKRINPSCPLSSRVDTDSLQGVDRNAPFKQRLEELADKRGTTVEKVGIETSSTPGCSLAHLRKMLGGKRKLTIAMIEAVARALDVAPGEFAEWRLAAARCLLDPDPKTGVGLADALANYSLVQEKFGLNEVGEPLAAEATCARRLPAHKPKPRILPQTGSAEAAGSSTDNAG